MTVARREILLTPTPPSMTTEETRWDELRAVLMRALTRLAPEVAVNNKLSM